MNQMWNNMGRNTGKGSLWQMLEAMAKFILRIYTYKSTGLHFCFNRSYIGIELFENGIYSSINPLSRNPGTISFAEISKKSYYTRILNVYMTQLELFETNFIFVDFNDV